MSLSINTKSLIIKKTIQNKNIVGLKIYVDTKLENEVITPPPIVVNATKVPKPGNCCSLMYNGKACKNKGRFTDSLKSNQWKCGIHSIGKDRVFEYNKHSTDNDDNILPDCAICHEKIDNTDDFTKTLCGHVYHTRCVESWKKYKHSCPMCRVGMFDSDKIANDSLIENHYILNKVLEIQTSMDSALVSYLDLKFKKSKRLQYIFDTISLLSPCQLVRMYKDNLNAISMNKEVKNLVF